MVIGGFGILLLMIMIIRHCGACVKEGVEEVQGRERAEGDGQFTYYGGGGKEKFKHNGHHCTWTLDSTKGHCYFDQVTHKNTYGVQLEGIAEMRKARANGNRKGTVYKYSDPQEKKFYIDWDTEEIYRLAKYWEYDGSHRRETWFYTDFDTMTKVIRKSDRQLEFEKACRERGEDMKFYDCEDIVLPNKTTMNTTSRIDDHCNSVICWQVYNRGESDSSKYGLTISNFDRA